jgi:hypothetical protein
MSFQTVVTERLKAITETLNSIGTNAKKIDELPVQSTLDAASKIHVSKGGTSQSLSVQKIIDAVNLGSYDKLITIGDIALLENEATIPANAEWKIDEIYYSNLADIVIPIALCDEGFRRKVILVADTSNDIYLVNGDETDGSIVVRPNIPPGTILVTEMDVTDSEIGTPTAPILGDIYVKKTERSNVFLTGSGVIDELLLADEKATIVFNGSITELKCITYSLLPYNGKRVLLLNLQATPVTIKNTTGPGIHFNFPNNQDYILKPNQAIEFHCDFSSFPYAHHRFIGETRNQISDIENLETELDLKVDKDGTKVLSDNNYTTSEKNKLASIDATHYLPPLQTTVQLSALPQAGISDKARVYVEVDLSDYFYDTSASSGDIAPDDQTGGIGFWRKVAVGGETAASIKTKYESNADTNAFTDTLKAKLDSITAIFTTALKTGYDGVVTGYTALMATGSRLITTGEITKLGNTSGTNTGDQDLSGLSLKPIQVTAQTLTAGSWTLVSGLYEYNLANANITTTSIVDVIPDNAYVSIVQVAQVLPKTLSGSGTVKLYSTNLPTGNIIVTINIWK